MANKVVEFARNGFNVESFMDAISRSIRKFGPVNINELIDSDDQINKFTDLISFTFNENQAVAFIWDNIRDYNDVECETTREVKKNSKYTDVYVETLNFPALIDFYKIKPHLNAFGGYNTFLLNSLHKYSHGLQETICKISQFATGKKLNGFKPYINPKSGMNFWKFEFNHATTGESLTMDDVYKLYISGSMEFTTNIVMSHLSDNDEIAYGFGICSNVKFVKTEIPARDDIVNPAFIISDFIIIPDNMICKFGMAKLVLQQFK